MSCVDDSSLCHTRPNQDQGFIDCELFLWLVKQDWCEAILGQMWGSTSLGRGGVFSELKEQFSSGRTPGCQWG